VLCKQISPARCAALASFDARFIVWNQRPLFTKALDLKATLLPLLLPLYKIHTPSPTVTPDKRCPTFRSYVDSSFRVSTLQICLPPRPKPKTSLMRMVSVCHHILPFLRIAANMCVAVFSKSYCPHCKATKTLLSDLGAKYYTIELDQVGM
jgi:hypothetical protein